MSKELTIEAEDFVEALEKAQSMMAESISIKELKERERYLDVLSGIKWRD